MVKQLFRGALVLCACAMIVASIPAGAMAITARIDQETAVFSPGYEGYLVLNVDIPRGSHIYGNPHGPGTGKPTVFSVPPVQDIVIEKARYLPAKKFKFPDDRDFVWIYEGSTKFFFPVKVNASAVPGVRNLTINIEGLLCTDSSCMPWEQTVRAEVRIVREDIGQRPFRHEYKVSVPGSESTVEGSKSADNGISDETALLEGIQLLPRHVSGGGVTGVLQAIVFGILAGLLLNFMPCVLPVVSIKILGFVRQAGEEKSIVVKSGLLFALGILTVFGVLACFAAFLGYGWGGLFQKTEFLVAMISVVFVLALSMFDVFTIHVPALAGKAAAGAKNTLTDAYIKGVLATFLATPCSGPFLGGTLAWAMLQPPLVIFLVFISVGAGMALPYLVLSMYPALLRFVPKPGEWMVTLERVMGFLLLGTAVYLAGILESAALVPTLWFLIFLLAGFWQYGAYGALHRERKSRLISFASLIAIVLCGYLLSFHVIYGGRGDEAEIGTSGFSVNRLLHNRESGTISVVKFTADWCPNCVFVEKTALYTRKVADKLKAAGADFMVADITRKNPAAEALLQKSGGRAIPFLAIFPPGAEFSSPLCLRDMYSEAEVLDAIDRALAGAASGDVDVDSIRFRGQ